MTVSNKTPNQFDLQHSRSLGPHHWVAVSNTKLSATDEQYLLPPGLYSVRATKETAFAFGASDVVAADVPVITDADGPGLIHEKEVGPDFWVTDDDDGYVDAYTTVGAETGFLIFSKWG